MNKKVRFESGFTLIEVMIVVLIIGALAAVAIPTYTTHIKKTQRTDAMASLQGLAQAMERFKLNNQTYVGADAAKVPTIFPAVSPPSGGARYDLTIEAATVSAFTLRATPITTANMADDGLIELNSVGEHWWDSDNNGSKADSELSWRQ